MTVRRAFSALMCSYGAFVGASLLLSIIDRKRLFSVTLIDTETGSRVRPTPLLVLQVTFIWQLLDPFFQLVMHALLSSLASSGQKSGSSKLWSGLKGMY